MATRTFLVQPSGRGYRVTRPDGIQIYFGFEEDADDYLFQWVGEERRRVVYYTRAGRAWFWEYLEGVVNIHARGLLGPGGLHIVGGIMPPPVPGQPSPAPSRPSADTHTTPSSS